MRERGTYSPRNKVVIGLGVVVGAALWVVLGGWSTTVDTPRLPGMPLWVLALVLGLSGAALVVHGLVVRREDWRGP